MSYPTFNPQPHYGGGGTSGGPGIVKQDNVYGNSSTTGSPIFDIDAFSSTGFDKPGRASTERGGVSDLSKIGHNSVPLAKIRSESSTIGSTSVMNDPFAPPPSQQQPPTMGNGGGCPPQDLQAFSGNGDYTPASAVQQPQNQQQQQLQQSSGSMMGYSPALQQGQMQQTTYPNQSSGQLPLSYPNQGQPQTYPAQREGMAPQYQQQPVQHYPTHPGIMQQPVRQPQQQQAVYGGLSASTTNYAGEGNPFGGHAAYMPPQSQLVPQGGRITGGGYVGNGQPEPYNLGTSSIPYRATNSVPPSHRAQVQANEWDPFGPGPNPIPAASVAVAATSAPTAGTENRQWDPFLEEDYKVTAHGPAGGGNTVNDSWTDIQDPQVWEPNNLPSKGYSDSNTVEEEADWSDDDDDLGAASDGDSRNKSKDSIQQEQADFEIALKLQREEEEKAQNEPNAAAQPYYERDLNDSGSRPDGEVLCRISRRTLLRKKWRHTYYIFDHPDVLLLYRSRDDFLYNPRGTMIKKQIEIRHTNTLTALKRKMYKEYGMLWHFTLEEMTDYGPSVVAKFASHERRIIEELGNRMADAIRDKRRMRSRLNSGYGPSRSYNTSGSIGSPDYRKHYGTNSGRERNDHNSSSYKSRTSDDKYSKWGTLS